MNDFTTKDLEDEGRSFRWVSAFLFGQTISVISPEVSYASSSARINEIYEVGELFDLSIQLIYLVLLLSLLGTGTYFVIRQVLVRRELDLSAKELQVRAHASFFWSFIFVDVSLKQDISYKVLDSLKYTRP